MVPAVVVVVLIGLILLVNRFLAQLYTNPVRPNRVTPADLGIDFQEIRIPTENNRNLYGWWIPASSRDQAIATLILVHGWGQNSEKMLPFVKEFHFRGYHLVTFDGRSHGQSDHDGYSTMLKFARDISATIRFVEQQFSRQRTPVGVVGFSIGGAATIYAAVHDPKIHLAVSIGAFAHPLDVMRIELEKKKIPYIPFVWLLFRFIELRVGFRFKDIAPVTNIPRLQKPLFLIHGEKDRVVPLSQAQKILQAAPGNLVEHWFVPGKGHFDVITHPEFWPRILEFLQRKLKTDR